MKDSLYCEDLRNTSGQASGRPDLHSRPEGALAQIVFFYMTQCILVLFVLVFAAFKFCHPSRARFIHLKERSFPYIILSHLGASFVSLIGSWFQATELRDGVPCWLFLIAYFTCVPLLVFPLMQRLFVLYRKKQFTTVCIIRTAVSKNHQNDDKESLVGSEKMTTVSSGLGKMRTVLVCLQTLIFYNDFSFRRKHTASSSTSGSNLSPVFLEQYQAREKAIHLRVKLIKFLKSPLGNYVSVTCLMAPYIVTAIIMLATSEFVAHGCWGCAPNKIQNSTLLAESIIALVLLIISYWINRKTVDPFGIVHEARLAVWFGGFWAVFFFVLQIILTPNLTKSNFQFSILVEFSLICYCFVQSVFQCILAVKYMKRDEENANHMASEFSIEEFEAKFLNRSGPFYHSFAKHVTAEYSYESLAFYESVSSWESVYFDVGPKTAKARAKKIANMFIGEHAELPCNLSSEKVVAIREALNNPATELTIDFFVEAKKEIVMMLYQDSFRRYLGTEKYKREAASIGGLMVAPSQGDGGNGAVSDNEPHRV